jgi:hypothetical protein
MEKVKKPLLPLMTKQLAVSLLIGGGYYALRHKRISS